MFETISPFPGVTHITDAMGVSFTLIEGTERAILFDTGYGTEDVAAFVGTLTEKPLTVLLSHGHHDHMLGARWFRGTMLCREDMDEFRERTGEGQRKKVMEQAEERGVPVPEDFITAVIPMPQEIRFSCRTGGFDTVRTELGGMTAWIVKVPGHTPGSIVIYVPERELLLTGDDWNPCTWMWFPSSLPATVWRENMTALISALEQESGTAVRNVLCSHQPVPRAGEELKEFLSWMTNRRLEEAPGVDMGAPIDTHQAVREERGWTLIFDRMKITGR